MNLSSTLCCLCFDSLELVASPMSVNASIGDVKEFSCVGSGESLYFFWKTNGEPADSKEGFSLHDTEFNNDTMLRTSRLTVNTSFVTNGTNITCTIGQLSPTSSEVTGAPAVILLQGTTCISFMVQQCCNFQADYL